MGRKPQDSQRLGPAKKAVQEPLILNQSRGQTEPDGPGQTDAYVKVRTLKFDIHCASFFVPT